MEGYLSSRFFLSTPIFPSPLPSLGSDLSVLLSFHLLSFSFVSLSLSLLSYSLCNSTLSALSSEPSHFLPSNTFHFSHPPSLPSHSHIVIFSWCISNPSSKYCAIKWFANRLTLTVDLMRSLKTGAFCGHRSV